MEHVVFIPAPYRDLTGGVERVQLTGASVRELVVALEARYPGMAARLCVDERLRPGISVAVNSVVESRGLRLRLEQPSEVHFLPSIGGGTLRPG